jgi:hypothetical protein
VFEGSFTCPTCHRDIRREPTEPTIDEEQNERRATMPLPVIRPKSPVLPRK